MYWLDGFILVGVAFTCVGALKKDLKTTNISEDIIHVGRN